MIESPEFNVLNHGVVQLLDVMGDDRRAANIARKSFRKGDIRSDEPHERLTKYLVTNRHNTPVEFNEVVFFLKMPIFVARQLVRHRSASIEEISLRYVRAVREFYLPDAERCQKQSETSKQGSSPEIVENPNLCRDIIRDTCNSAFDAYELLIQEGMSKELARTVLPLGTYTEWYWKCDLHNVLHMLGLRLDPHAQYEIRVYAEAILASIESIFPTVIAAWKGMPE